MKLSLLVSVLALCELGSAAPQCPPKPRSGPTPAPPQTPPRRVAPPNPGAPTTPGPSAPTTPGDTVPATPGPTAPTTPGSSGPTTPRGSAPRAPAPHGPTTPGPRAGGAGTAPGRRGPKGAPMVFTRGRTAKERLSITWDTPVYEHKAVAGDRTAAAGRRVLTRKDALQFVRGKDPRPLLVLRECHLCVGSDFALLSRALDNDRTMLLTYWFHCVKLPASVRDPKHPLAALFEGAVAPHLFFASNDGETVRTLPGSQTQSQLWATMTDVLRASYRKDPTQTIKELLAILDEFDVLDAKEAELRRQLDRAVEGQGPKSSRFKALRARYRKVEAERKALLAREAKLRELPIK